MRESKVPPPCPLHSITRNFSYHVIRSGDEIGKHRAIKIHSIARGKAKPSLEGKTLHRPRESKTLTRRKEIASPDALKKDRSTDFMLSLCRIIPCMIKKGTPRLPEDAFQHYKTVKEPTLFSSPLGRNSRRCFLFLRS